MKRGRKPGHKLSFEAKKSFRDKMRAIWKKKQAECEKEIEIQVTSERKLEDFLRDLESVHLRECPEID